MREASSKRGYNAQWRKLRLCVLADEPMCRYCAELGQTTPAHHVDHIIPVRERPDLRLERSNLQPLCALHHNSTKAKEERIGRRIGCGLDGYPLEW